MCFVHYGILFLFIKAEDYRNKNYKIYIIFVLKFSNNNLCLNKGEKERSQVSMKTNQSKNSFHLLIKKNII